MSESDKISTVELLMAIKDDLGRLISDVKHLEKDCTSNAEKITACFRRIDELKEKDVQLIRENGELKAMIEERTNASEKALRKDIGTMEKDLATKLGAIGVVISLAVIFLKEYIVKFFKN